MHLSAQGFAHPSLLADLEAVRADAEVKGLPIVASLGGYPVTVQPNACGRRAGPPPRMPGSGASMKAGVGRTHVLAWIRSPAHLGNRSPGIINPWIGLSTPAHSSACSHALVPLSR